MHLRLFPAAILFASVCHAQETRPVECRFLAFGAGGQAAEAIALDDKGGDITCPLPTTKLSKKITCHAKDGKIPFILPGDRKPMATATVPAGVKSAIVIFVGSRGKPGAPPAGGTVWNTFVIEDSAKNFPDGGTYIANLSPGDIRFVVGEHKGLLKPGMSHGYAMPRQRDDFNMAPVVFEFKTGENWRIGNESSLRFLPGMRYLVFAYLDPASGRPKIHTLQDMALPAEAPAP